MARQRCPPSRKDTQAVSGSSSRIHTRRSRITNTRWNVVVWVASCVVMLMVMLGHVLHSPKYLNRWWYHHLSSLMYQSAVDSNGVPVCSSMPKRNRNLEMRLGELIQHAKAEAESKGFFTETGASVLRVAEQKRRVRSMDSNMAMLRDAVGERKRKVVLCRSNADCGRGACVGSKCVCAVGYVGTQCTRPIHLIVEKDERDIETQRRVVLPLGGTDYFTDKTFGEDVDLLKQCAVFYSRKEEEMYRDDGEPFILYPDLEKRTPLSSNEEDEDGEEDLIQRAYVEHVFGSSGATEENMHALETLFTALRECLFIRMYAGKDHTLLHTYVLDHLEKALVRGFEMV